MTALPRDNKRGNRFYFVVPTAHLIFVYDAGYAFMVERPEAFAEVVADFFERSDAFVISRTKQVVFP
jgi:hypothetical protein